MQKAQKSIKIIILLLVALVSTVATVDLCTIPASPITLSTRLQCFNSIPFNATVKEETLQVIQKVFEIYPFAELSKAPPLPFSHLVSIIIQLFSNSLL